MSDIKLFKINNSSVQELSGKSVALEKSLQELMDASSRFIGFGFWIPLCAKYIKIWIIVVALCSIL